MQSASVGGLGTSTERAAKLLAELRALTAGEYEVRGEIGRGGMAVVYLAYDLRLNRKVAIKAMLPDLAFHDGMEERFKREARTAARLDHPNIVVIYSVRDSGDPLFFVMKFVDGAALDAVVKTHGPLPIHAVQGLLIQLCSALQYAHDNGVVHRDVKPANILLDAHGAVQVTDFGIAKAADSAHLTRTGLAIGTPTYMCPEQCMGHAQTNASDQYAVGIVAYELLTGNPPFTGSGVATQWAHIQDVPKPLADARPDCPDSLVAAVMRMLSKDPNERFPSLRDAMPMIARGLPLEADAGRPALADLVRRTATNRPPFTITPASPVPHQAARRVEMAAPTPARAVERPEIHALTVDPQQLSLETGTTERVRCRAVDARGNPVGATPSWSSSNPSIASVDDSGTVTAHLTGSVKIAAMVDALAAMTTVDVTPARVSRVDVEPSVVSLPEHGTVKLAVRAFSAKGKQVSAPIEFKSADPQVAKIAADGTLSGVAQGKTTAVVSVGGVEKTIIIRVTAAKVSSLGIAPAARTIVIGEELLLTATASDASGHGLEGHVVTWRSLTPSIAKVSARGRVVARQAGTATIVAEYDGLEARTDLTVTEAGRKRTFTGAWIAIAATVLAGVGIWAFVRRSPSGEQASTAAASAGTVAPAPAAAPPARTVVTPPPAPAIPAPADTVIATIDLTEKSPAGIEVGDARTLGIRAANRRGQPIPLASLKWESTNPDVATVDSAGYLTAVAVGRTTVTARGAGRERVLAIDVRPAAAASMTLAITHDSLEVGDTASISAELFDKREARVEYAVTWKSSNDAVATVDAAGAVHAVGVGQAVIAGAVAAVSDSVTVFVSPARPTVSDAGLDSARLATSSLRTIAPSRATSRAVAPRAEGALPAGVRAPSDAEAKSIADSIVVMIGRRVVRVAQLTKAQGEPGVQFNKFLDRESPAARVAGVPTLGDVRAASARVSFPVVLEWRTFTQSRRERTVNVDAIVEPVRGGWVIRELRFPTGFAP